MIHERKQMIRQYIYIYIYTCIEREREREIYRERDIDTHTHIQVLRCSVQPGTSGQRELVLRWRVLENSIDSISIVYYSIV